MKNNPTIGFILFFLLFTACTNRPWNVLSEKKMENLLFDLYIAETEIKENSPVFQSDSLRKQQLLHSVFEKHHVSEKRFDTSLVWYNAHLDRYLKINEKLTERYTLLITKLQAEVQKTNLPKRRSLTFKEMELKDFTTPIFTFHPLHQDSDAIRPDSIQKKYILWKKR
ncbi:hypothetical protein FACS189428_0250 [Clostridia bacterium]|nr:hypothetical protein FACS189428_0250 [Clostridia bacterium]